MNKSFLIVNYASLREKRSVGARIGREREMERESETLSFRTITRNVQPPAYIYVEFMLACDSPALPGEKLL